MSNREFDVGLANPSLHLLRRVVRIVGGRDLFVRREIARPATILGNSGASWSVDLSQLDQASIVYSFGVGTDVSFDLALIESTGAIVHAFDPTPRSIEWLKTQQLPNSFKFWNFGLADYDGKANFFAPAVDTHVSYSLVNQQSNKEPPVVAQVYRLISILKMLGHSHVDLLKLDIEGAEYSVIPDLVGNKVDVRQLLVEFHHRFPGIGAKATRSALTMLRKAGFAIFHVSPNGEEYGLIRN